MLDLPPKYLKVADLLSFHIDGLATTDEQHELNDLLLSDEALLQYAARWLFNESLLRGEFPYLVSN